MKQSMEHASALHSTTDDGKLISFSCESDSADLPLGGFVTGNTPRVNNAAELCGRGKGCAVM